MIEDRSVARRVVAPRLRDAAPVDSSAVAVSVIALAFYVIAVVVSCLPEVEGLSKLLAPGVVLSVTAATGFVRQGGAVVTPSAVACYGILVFGGFPAIYAGLGLGERASEVSTLALLAAVSLCFALLLTILMVCPRRRHLSYRQLEPEDAASSRRWYGTAAVLFGAGVAASVLGVHFIADALGFLAIVAAGLAAFGPGRPSLTWRSAVGPGIFVLGYAALIFDGFGRLNLGVLAMAVVMLASLHYRTLKVKIGLLLITAPAIAYLAAQRLSHLQEVRGAAAGGGEGLGSVVGPLVSSALIVDARLSGEIPASMGSTLWSALVVWVPRSVWPDKPVGFGAEMVSVTQPHLARARGFSDAALITGEAVWNFGLAFAFVLLAAVALALRGLDGWLERNDGRPVGLESKVNAALIVSLSASMLNLVWGGFFTQTSRVLFVVVLLLVFKVMVSATRRRGLTSSPPGRSAVSPGSGNRLYARVS